MGIRGRSISKAKYRIWKLKYCRIHSRTMNIICKDWYSKVYVLVIKNSLNGMPNDGNANIEKFYFILAIWNRINQIYIKITFVQYIYNIIEFVLNDIFAEAR